MNNAKLPIVCGNLDYGKELARMLSRFDFITTAVGLDDAERCIRNEDFASVIFDINAPKSFDGTGIDTAKRLKAIKPIKAIGITMFFHSCYDDDLKNERLDGYLLRNMNIYEIVAIINQVLNGRDYISVPDKYKPRGKAISE